MVSFLQVLVAPTERRFVTAFLFHPLLGEFQMRTVPLSRLIALCLIAFPMSSLTTSRVSAEEHEHIAADVPTFGVALLMPTKDSKVRGMLRLMQKEDGLHIVGRVNNLTPGEHGFHIHEFGDLRSSDGTSAGGHFNPEGHEHGAPGAKSHAGDLGNITAGEDGVAKVDIVATDAKLHVILGRALVVHAGKDDLSSQPSGDAGGRVALGVIAVGNPDLKQAK
jgi:Cu-Zn family superoxide dismutase